MAEWTKKEIDKVYQQALNKSAKDADFRAKLLKDPNKAISELSGKDVPGSVKIKIVEKDPNYAATFVLPDLLSDEFSDEELDKVAGGLCIVDACAAAAGASVK